MVWSAKVDLLFGSSQVSGSHEGSSTGTKEVVLLSVGLAARIAGFTCNGTFGGGEASSSLKVPRTIESAVPTL